MALKIDLHTHTTHSDGSHSPTEIVQMAAANKVGVLAITDHDAISGLEEASEVSLRLGVTLVPGTELTVYHEEREYHLLGYFFDTSLKWFTDQLDQYQRYRVTRMERMIERLDAEGVSVTLDEVLHERNGSIGRPHLARVLVAKGFCSSIGEAFRRYLVPGKPAYVEKFQVSLLEGIEILHKAGGLAVMAHPGISTLDDGVIRRAHALGMDGLEAYHYDHSGQQVAHFAALCEELNMIPTGGSDFHGGRIRATSSIGKTNVPTDTYDRMLARLDLRPRAE